MPSPRQHPSLPLHPHFRSALPGALSAAFDGTPGLIALDPRGGLALGRYRLRPADDRILRVELADTARLGGVGAVRLDAGGVIIPDLDGTLGRALPFPGRQAGAQALALARATLLQPGGAAALARAEGRRCAVLARRTAGILRAAAPEAAAALRALDCQLELACHLHELPPGESAPLAALLADRRAVRDLARAPLDRLRLRGLARGEAPGFPARLDRRARDARLDAYFAALDAPSRFGARRARGTGL
jgi:hypothetical protein